MYGKWLRLLSGIFSGLHEALMGIFGTRWLFTFRNSYNFIKKVGLVAGLTGILVLLKVVDCVPIHSPDGQLSSSYLSMAFMWWKWFTRQVSCGFELESERKESGSISLCLTEERNKHFFGNLSQRKREKYLLDSGLSVKRFFSNVQMILFRSDVWVELLCSRRT